MQKYLIAAVLLVSFADSVLAAQSIIVAAGAVPRSVVLGGESRGGLVTECSAFGEGAGGAMTPRAHLVISV